MNKPLTSIIVLLILLAVNVTAETNISMSQMDVETCPETTADSLNLWLVVAVSFVVMFLGILSRVYVFGFFGGILLMISSWYVSPCQSVYAYAMTLFALFVMVWSVVKGFGGKGY